MFKEFRAFILRGNVVDLAVGVVIGAAFGAIVTALVSGMINPLVSFVGTGDLGAKHFCIGTPVRLGGPCPHVFRYGQVFTAMISFVIIAAVVFFFVVKPVNHLMEMFKAEEPKEKTTRDCPECLSSIPVAATRCAYCTAKVAAAS